MPLAHPPSAAAPEAEVVLRDGSTVHVRPVLPGDEPALRRFFEALSPESRHLRFFTGAPDLASAARAAVEQAVGGDVGLLATRAGAIVAHAICARIDDDHAEVAFAVADELHGEGLATLLLLRLAEAAAERGIGVLVADVLPGNREMVAVFRDSGLATSRHSEPGVVVVECATALGPEARARFERREDDAAAAALAHVLRPASVAVIGASDKPGTVGFQVLENLRTGYRGRLHAVNPRATSLDGLPCHPSVLAVPGDVELAVIAVPADAVPGVAQECAAKGVRALVVLSAGFAETSGAGGRRQQVLVDICRASGMRLVGPNCLGVLNAAPDVRLDATFAPVRPSHGHVGFLSQSGALAIAALAEARERGIGLSSMVSIGDKADLSGNDLLRWWEHDPDTSVVLLYLESFGNPRAFRHIARRVGRTKPIVALKAGRTPAGSRAASSHTGALLASSDVGVDALFTQAGVIRSETASELFDVGTLLAHQPLPAGDRVAILTNAGGPAILCADACVAGGLHVEELGEETRRRLAAFLPATAAVANPVDMIATASADDYERALGILLADPEVDAVIAIFIPPLSTRPVDVGGAIRRAAEARERDVPVLGVFMTPRAPRTLRTQRVQVPSYAYPEDAARALAAVAGHARWLRRAPGTVPELEDVRAEEAAAIIARALQDDPDGGGWLAPLDAAALLGCYGIPLVPARLVTTAAEAGLAAGELGGPVALKGVASGLVHKTEAHAVRLDLADGAAAEAAAEAMAASLADDGHEVEGFLVQRMAGAGTELLVGVVHDPTFGPLVACGAGGTAAELLGDVSVRLTPLTDVDAHEMVRALRTFPLLDGFRGAPPADVAALEDVLVRVAALADAHPELAELDLNPLVAGPDGAVAVDARVRLARPRTARRGTPARHAAPPRAARRAALSRPEA